MSSETPGSENGLGRVYAELLRRLVALLGTFFRRYADYLVPIFWIGVGVSAIDWLQSDAGAATWNDAHGRWTAIAVLGLVSAANGIALVHRLGTRLAILPAGLTDWLGALAHAVVQWIGALSRTAATEPKQAAVASGTVLAVLALAGLHNLGRDYIDIEKSDRKREELSMVAEADARDRTALEVASQNYLASDRRLADALSELSARIDGIRARVETPFLVPSPSVHIHPTQPDVGPEIAKLERLGEEFLSFTSAFSARQECIARFLRDAEWKRQDRTIPERVKLLFSRADRDLTQELVRSCPADDDASREALLGRIREAFPQAEGLRSDPAGPASTAAR